MRRALRSIIIALLVSGAACWAQETARAIYQRYAPVDLTGNWVSVVTEDWAIRMLTPGKGDFASLPLNAAGQKIGNEWDPAHDQQQASYVRLMARRLFCAFLAV